MQAAMPAPLCIITTGRNLYDMLQHHNLSQLSPDQNAVIRIAVDYYNAYRAKGISHYTSSDLATVQLIVAIGVMGHSPWDYIDILSQYIDTVDARASSSGLSSVKDDARMTREVISEISLALHEHCEQYGLG